MNYHRYLAWCPPLPSYWFSFYCCTIGDSLGVTLGGFPGFIFSGVFIDVSLGATLGGLSGFLVCVFTLGVGAWFWCCLVGYSCFICSRACSGSFYTSYYILLCLFVDCFYATLGTILNNYARFLSVVWCVSFIVAKVAFGVGCFNASTKYWAANVAASEDDTLGIFTFCGKIPRHQQFFLISFLSQIIFSIYIVPMPDRCTICLIRVCSMLHVAPILHVKLILFPVVPWALRWNKIVRRFSHTPITLGFFLMLLIK